MRFRLSLDEDPRVIAWAQTALGRLALLGLFMAGMKVLHPTWRWPAITAAVAASAFAGAYRRPVAGLATLSILLLDPFWWDFKLERVVADQEGLSGQVDFTTLRHATLAAVFLFSAAVLYCRRRFPSLLIFRRCILSLILFFFGLVLLARSRALSGFPELALWSFIGGLGAYFWFLGYALLDRERGPLTAHLGWFHPFWGSSFVPFGKGDANLRQVEARTPGELAACQLQGFQLLLSCLGAQAALYLIGAVVHRGLGLPTFHAAFELYLKGAPYHWSLCWASLWTAFVESVLNFMVWGNTLVACARMAGFRLLRNTYRPFQARSVAEFWNRYYFYFKELLAEFFFYPTYLRCFKDRPRMRVAFATFMAAGVGNLIYHFIRDIALVAELGLGKALAGYQTYAFYALLLSGAIAASQLSESGSRGGGWPRTTAWPMFRVMGVFSVLHVFDDLRRELTLLQHLRFLAHLFGMG